MVGLAWNNAAIAWSDAIRDQEILFQDLKKYGTSSVRVGLQYAFI